MRVPVLAATTSHKAEPLLPTLEIFGRLGLNDVDLNLHHVIELGTPVDAIREQAGRCGVRIHGLAGGWCDFFDSAPKIEATFASIDRQVDIARQLGVTIIRLFFGRLSREAYTPAARDTAVANLKTLSARHPSMRFMIENHGRGASGYPDVCREILSGVDRPNIRMNFDPINFEHIGLNALDAARLLAPFVGHVHLKGLENGDYCEFGVGDVDLAPVIRVLADAGFDGFYSVEYEGHLDKTLRLYESVKRARRAVGDVGSVEKNNT
jgi:sugar phosphate isomerase/epimerase